MRTQWYGAMCALALIQLLGTREGGAQEGTQAFLRNRSFTIGTLELTVPEGSTARPYPNGSVVLQHARQADTLVAILGYLPGLTAAPAAEQLSYALRTWNVGLDLRPLSTMETAQLPEGSYALQPFEEVVPERFSAEGKTQRNHGVFGLVITAGSPGIVLRVSARGPWVQPERGSPGSREYALGLIRQVLSRPAPPAPPGTQRFAAGPHRFTVPRDWAVQQLSFGEVQLAFVEDTDSIYTQITSTSGLVPAPAAEQLAWALRAWRPLETPEFTGEAVSGTRGGGTYAFQPILYTVNLPVATGQTPRRMHAVFGVVIPAGRYGLVLAALTPQGEWSPRKEALLRDHLRALAVQALVDDSTAFPPMAAADSLATAHQERNRLVALGHDAYTRGEMRLALLILERAREVTERFGGSRSPEMGGILGSLGAAHLESGDLPRAQQVLEQAREIYRAAGTLESRDGATILNNLAGVYLELADVSQAQTLYEEALAIRRRILSPTDPELASSLNNLAALHAGQRDAARAEALYDEAISIYRSRSPGSAQLALVMSSFASVLLDLGRDERARGLLEEALSIWQSGRYGHEPSGTATTLTQLGALEARSGNLPRADSLLTRAAGLTLRTLAR